MSSPDAVQMKSHGSGPSLLLLHANGGDHDDFAAVGPALAESGWRVTTVDWPGHGQSPRSEPATAVSFGELLVRILDELGGEHVLLGNSVGGFAALYGAAQRPNHVAGLVLVSPGGFSPQWIGTKLACRAFGSPRLAPVVYRNLPRLYLRSRNAGVAAAIERAREGSRSPQRVKIYASLWRSFADPDHDGRALAAAVRCPTLLAWGTHDPVLPWRLDGRRARRALPHAQTVSFPGAGHQPFIDRPDEFIFRTAPFLAGLHAGVNR